MRRWHEGSEERDGNVHMPLAIADAFTDYINAECDVDSAETQVKIDGENKESKRQLYLQVLLILINIRETQNMRMLNEFHDGNFTLHLIKNDS